MDIYTKEFVEVLKAQRNAAMDAVADLSAQLSLLFIENQELKALHAERKDDGSDNVQG